MSSGQQAYPWISLSQEQPHIGESSWLGLTKVWHGNQPLNLHLADLAHGTSRHDPHSLCWPLTATIGIQWLPLPRQTSLKCEIALRPLPCWEGLDLQGSTSCSHFGQWLPSSRSIYLYRYITQQKGNMARVPRGRWVSGIQWTWDTGAVSSVSRLSFMPTFSKPKVGEGKKQKKTKKNGRFPQGPKEKNSPCKTPTKGFQRKGLAGDSVGPCISLNMMNSWGPPWAFISLTRKLI